MPIHKGKVLKREEDWQFAPLHWVFAVKNGLRHKARMVMGGHVTNADDLDKYAATTSMNGVKLQLYLTSRSKKKLISGDVGSAYLNSFTQEKIWTVLGPEFGDLQGKVEVVKSLYGLITSANAWFRRFTNTIKEFGFHQSKIMPCLWYKLCDDGKSYDYLTHHVDDFLLTSNDPAAFIYVRNTL